MDRFHAPHFPRWGVILGAGVIAGVAATLAQVALWLLFTADFPGILFRDARLTAALVLGDRALAASDIFEADIWIAATFIHFALSILYAALLTPLAMRPGGVRGLLAGAAAGLALYAVNLYGFTEIFPWFIQARGWIAAAAHAVFGATAVAVCRALLVRKYAQLPPGVH